MAYAVVFSSQAESEIDKIVSYIGQDNPEAALRFGKKLLARAQFLAENPHVGPRMRLRNIRYILSYPYLIFYQINEEAKTVEILRFWHGARSPRALRFD